MDSLFAILNTSKQKTIGDSGIEVWQIVAIFFAFMFAVILVSWFKKMYYRFWLRKKYYIIPRPGIKGIANIAMVVALSVAVLILMTLITSNLFSVLFRAFPGTRVTIEGILIKIGGLLFGPFLGLFIGLLTDLLSVLMTAGIFHYGYFIAALAYGLFAGLIRTIVTFSNKNHIKFGIYSTIAIIVTMIISFFYFSAFLPQILEINFLVTISLQKVWVIIIIESFLFVSIICIWIFFGLSYRQRKYLNYLKKLREFGSKSGYEEKMQLIASKKNKKNKSDKFIAFCATITCVVITEVFINVQAMPIFDAQITTITQQQWLAIRIALFIPMVLLNMAIIYPVYTIVTPLVTYNYETELSESLSVKYEND